MRTLKTRAANHRLGARKTRCDEWEHRMPPPPAPFLSKHSSNSIASRKVVSRSHWRARIKKFRGTLRYLVNSKELPRSTPFFCPSVCIYFFILNGDENRNFRKILNLAQIKIQNFANSLSFAPQHTRELGALGSWHHTLASRKNREQDRSTLRGRSREGGGGILVVGQVSTTDNNYHPP